MTLRAKAYAKINRFLSVGSADTRGYHPIRTIFQTIGLSDDVSITPSEADSVTFSLPGIPDVNTVTRAVGRLREFVAIPQLHIHVEKRIPKEAGLGGGSSDAATVLRLAARFASYPVDPQSVREVAASIGADVSFFLVGGLAMAEGYGEIVTSLPNPPEEWLVVAMPDVSCPTEEAYRKLDELAFGWLDFPHSDEMHNDFERVAPCESLDLIERLLSIGANDAHLCGSGSAVFGVFGGREEAEQAAQKLPCDTWVVPTIDREASLGFTRDP